MLNSNMFPHTLSDSQTQFLGSVLIKYIQTNPHCRCQWIFCQLVHKLHSQLFPSGVVTANWFSCFVCCSFFFSRDQLLFLTQHQPAGRTWESVPGGHWHTEPLSDSEDLYSKSFLCLLNWQQFYVFVLCLLCRHSLATPPISYLSQHNPGDTRPRLTWSREPHSRILEQYNINAED